MTETFSLDIELPEFMKLVDAEVRQQILQEVSEKIIDEVSELFERTAKEIVVKRMDLLPKDFPAERPEEPGISEDIMEVKTTLAEEVISMSADDALQKLRLSLARGEIDEDTYEELKALVEPVKVTRGGGVVACPQCGKQMESTVNFCRFCGAKLK